MDKLKQVLREEIVKYAGKGANCYLFSLTDDDHLIYGINAVRYDKRSVSVVILARIVDGLIIIEEDKTDKPLVDALLYREIPREQIILAYADEVIPQLETS